MSRPHTPTRKAQPFPVGPNRRTTPKCGDVNLTDSGLFALYGPAVFRRVFIFNLLRAICRSTSTCTKSPK